MFACICFSSLYPGQWMPHLFWIFLIQSASVDQVHTKMAFFLLNGTSAFFSFHKETSASINKIRESGSLKHEALSSSPRVSRVLDVAPHNACACLRTRFFCLLRKQSFQPSQRCHGREISLNYGREISSQSLSRLSSLSLIPSPPGCSALPDSHFIPSMALLPPLDLAAVARVPSVARARPGSRTTASASPSPTATLLTGERLVVFLFTTPVHLAVLLVILVAAALVVELAQDGSRCAPLRSSLPQGAERLSPCASAVADRSSAPHCGASTSPWMNATSPWMSHSSVSYRESSTPRATDTRFHSSWSGARSSAALTRSAGCTSPASSDTSLKALPGRTLPSSTMHVASSGLWPAPLVFVEEEGWTRRCLECNENGMARCPNCCS
jgi:hypothetical protein